MECLAQLADRKDIMSGRLLRSLRNLQIPQESRLKDINPSVDSD